MDYGLYNHQLPSLIIGFHGCDADVADQVLKGSPFPVSGKGYNWLGEGVYFWDNNPTRAKEWAEDLQRKGKIKSPAIVGAVLKLGRCLDLLDSSSNSILEAGYRAMLRSAEKEGIPTNKNVGKDTDLLLRYRDNAVIEMVKALAKRNDKNAIGYDSVRGVFPEGEEIYPGAGFRKKDHIQICICNPNCIKGVFLPRVEDAGYWVP